MPKDKKDNKLDVEDNIDTSSENITEANMAISEVLESFKFSDLSVSFIESSLDSNFKSPPRNSLVSELRTFSSLSVKREIPETIVTASTNESSIEVR